MVHEWRRTAYATLNIDNIMYLAKLCSGFGILDMHKQLWRQYE